MRKEGRKKGNEVGSGQVRAECASMKKGKKRKKKRVPHRQKGGKKKGKKRKKRVFVRVVYEIALTPLEGGKKRKEKIPLVLTKKGKEDSLVLLWMSGKSCGRVHSRETEKGGGRKKGGKGGAIGPLKRKKDVSFQALWGRIGFDKKRKKRPLLEKKKKEKLWCGL